MAQPLQNTWHHRRVAEASAKPCWICYKPTASVLITPDSKDHFYICPGHLKDRQFCIPDADEVAAVAEKTRKAELEKEVEKVKREYEERQKKKKEARKAKEEEEKKKGEGKDDGASKEEKEKNAEEDKKDEKERDEKIKALTHADQAPARTEDEGPRIFTLQKSFYQMRLDRIRNAEIARRNRERLKNPTLFPSVPTGDP